MQMDQLILHFSKQLTRAMEIGEKSNIQKPSKAIQNIFISGLGGSGIGGTILAQILFDKIKIPVIVNKDYFIPAFVGENTLVIISSYSGNTEETLNVLHLAQQSGAKIVCVSSGGAVLETAKSKGLDYIEIDGGLPPRACFGLSFTQLFYVLNKSGLVDDSFKTDLKHAITLLDKEENVIQEQAMAIAENLVGRIPVIYSDASFEGIAIRFRQQINENAKMLCWHHVIPEMNHNELVGWRSEHKDITVVFLRNHNDFGRNQERMEFTKKVAQLYCGNIIEIFSKGESTIEKSLYLIHLVDWVSQYLGVMNGFDPIEIDVINKLKSSLAKKPL